VDYSSFLPEIDVKDGIARVVNNEQLYLKLLKKFDGEKMRNAITNAIEANNMGDVAYATHAMRGAASNLGFGSLLKIASEIEELAKSNQDCKHLCAPLEKAVDDLNAAIARLLEEKS